MAMWNQYDEDLNENVFLRELLSHHDDIVQRVSTENWIICVPRQGTVQPPEMNTELILDHVIVTSPTSKHQLYTLSKKPLLVKDKKIIYVNCYLTNSVEIHFEETFYINNLKCTVWCLSSPLFINRSELQPIDSLETSEQCADYLWSEGLGDILDNVQELCKAFTENHANFEVEDLQSLKELVGSLYSRCLQVALKSKKFKRKVHNDKYLDLLKLAVETYMQTFIGHKLLRAINTLMCEKNSNLNKIINNCVHLSLPDLNLPNELSNVINKAKSELGKINNYRTVLDKIHRLQQTFLILYSSNKMCITTDTVLQILVYLISKLHVNNWASNLLYLKELRFGELNVSNYVGFLITSLEAAVEFIRSKEFVQLQLTINRCDDEHHLFKLVKSNDLAALKNALKCNNKLNNRDIELCHPLCNCKDCSNFNEPTCLDVINESGQTLLICATLWGFFDIVEFLIGSGAPINCADYSGKTPMHYACARGRQDILLALMNSNADVNIEDQDGNSPLHSAVFGGHEHCVKALLYLAKLQVNSCNKTGDTALHVAVRFSYIDIIKLLLDNGALLLRNKRNQTALELAQDHYSHNLLKDYVTNDTVCIEKNAPQTKPKTPEPAKRVDVLLKAIENNDLPLVCFYLGFSNNAIQDTVLKCHPLCNCEKCEDFDLILDKTPDKINVNDYNADGYTPLHYAAKYGRTEILRILLDSKACPNLKTQCHLYTPLHLACIHQRMQVVKELVKCGDCEIDCKDQEGNTPLYYACMKNDRRLVELLLVNGADCNVRDNAGVTVMARTKDKQLFGITKVLKDSRSTVESDEDLF